MPGSSLIWGNVRPCLSMNPWNVSSSPVQATPTKLTVSPNFFAASSTEGASRLHVLQLGAQNQNTVGLPASDATSSSPPPTRGALNCNEAGTTRGAASAGAAAGSAADGSAATGAAAAESAGAASSTAAVSASGASAADVSASGSASATTSGSATTGSAVSDAVSDAEPPPHAAISSVPTSIVGISRAGVTVMTLAANLSVWACGVARFRRRFADVSRTAEHHVGQGWRPLSSSP